MWKKNDIRRMIYANGEFSAYGDLIDKAFTDWKSFADTKLKKLDSSVSAKNSHIRVGREYNESI